VNNIEMKNIPTRLWKYLCNRTGNHDELTPADMSNKQLDALVDVICRDKYRVTGKSTFKEEFVTAGGVDLKNLDLRRFESKICPGLFLIGEVLNIDALTGGFNFQAAWTGAFLAATAIAERKKELS
jgi:predicted flavoprotein YhiN